MHWEITDEQARKIDEGFAGYNGHCRQEEATLTGWIKNEATEADRYFYRLFDKNSIFLPANQVASKPGSLNCQTNMPATKRPFTETDRRLVKRALTIRIILGIVFLVPLLVCLGLVSYNSIIDFKKNNYDFMSFAGIVIFIAGGYLFVRFVIPFYRKSFKSIRANDKLVIETRISSIKQKYTGKGMHYFIETADISFDSWKVSLLSPGLPFAEMNVGMKIKIHKLENNNTDILYIEKG